MSSSSWKDRLARLPVLGNLVVGLRGVYTLGTWRTELRQQQVELLARLEAQNAAHDAALTAVRHELAELRAALQGSRDSSHKLAGDLLALRHTLQEASDQERVRSTRQTHTVSWAVQRMDRLEGDLARARAALDHMAVQIALVDEPDAPAGVPAAAIPVVPEPVAALLARSPALQALEHCLAALPDPDQAMALGLDDLPPTSWLGALQSVEHAGLSLVIALDDEARGRPALPAFLGAAREALAPGGLLALAFPNPENLRVAIRLLQQEDPAGTTAARAERLARDAGFVDVRVIRADGDPLVAGRPAEEPGPQELHDLLRLPTRFYLLARKVV